MDRNFICVEEHFSFPDHIELLARSCEKNRRLLYDAPFLGNLNSEAVKRMLDRLCDLGERRIEEMDEHGIAVQVLSLVSPGVQCFEKERAVELAREYNDRLYDCMNKNPDRFVGLSCLPVQDPDKAAEELERCVLKLGFKGAVINSHVGDDYLDSRKYWVIFETAEKLDVAIYLHPRAPSSRMIEPFDDYPILSSATWGFGVEVGLHILRLICSGLFDKYERLKIVIGHMGEGIPGQLLRIDRKWQILPFDKKAKMLPSDYFKKNIYVTTSGLCWEPVLRMSLEILPADHILFATDYPMEDLSEEVACIERADIPIDVKKKILKENAERVFGI